MNKLQKVIAVLQRVDALYEVLQQQEADAQESARLYAQMKKRGLLPKMGDPTKYLGVALNLASMYNLMLGSGMSSCLCGVSLIEKYWVGKIKENVKSHEFGSFFDDQPHDEIHVIGAQSYCVQFAICKCLIHADIAGVLRRE